MEDIKRNEIATLINTAPLGVAKYELLGMGITDASIEMNPKTSSFHAINATRATTSTDSYAPTMPIEQTCFKGDPAFDYLDNMRQKLAVLEDAETDVVNVWMYKTGGPTAYPAEKQPVVIAFEKMGDEGGKSAKVNYTIHYNGDPVKGTFNASTKTFTPAI